MAYLAPAPCVALYAWLNMQTPGRHDSPHRWDLSTTSKYFLYLNNMKNHLESVYLLLRPTPLCPLYFDLLYTSLCYSSATMGVPVKWLSSIPSIKEFEETSLRIGTNLSLKIVWTAQQVCFMHWQDYIRHNKWKETEHETRTSEQANLMSRRKRGTQSEFFERLDLVGEL